MKLVSILILTLCTAGSALAGSDVTWVASTGTNNVNCSRLTPCATFAKALLATNANGVIKTVDDADFGIVFIAKNVSIDGNGTGATIGAGANAGITINNTGGQVTIRNLTINVATGGDGIDINGGDVHLENVLILGTPSGSFAVNASGSTASPVHVTIKNVTITNAFVGITIDGASASLRDSVIRGSGNTGIEVASLSGQGAVALVERCEISYNKTGLNVDNQFGAGSTVRVSDSVITGNGTGISATNGGQIISFRTNMLAGNTTDGTTPFSVSLK
jgi:hypothetical protein